MEENQTTSPPISNSIQMDFPNAIKEVTKGRLITRISWENTDYCLVANGWLSISREGKLSQWIVNDGDLAGTDWIVLND